MIKIGITGSIGSGKSTVSKIFSDFGIPVFNADEVVRSIYKKDANVKKKLLKILPRSVKQNRNLQLSVKDEILKNNNFIKKVENIIHPIVRRKISNFLSKNKKLKNPIVALDIPLIIESNLKKKFDKIILIYCVKKIRRKRYIKKNKGKKIFFNFVDKKQLSFSKKRKYADFVINNSYNLNRTIKRTKKTIARIINRL